MTATALSANPKEYRGRLADQSDDQIDAWVAELLRDVVIRRGIVKVVADFQRAATQVVVSLPDSKCDAGISPDDASSLIDDTRRSRNFT